MSGESHFPPPAVHDYTLYSDSISPNHSIQIQVSVKITESTCILKVTYTCVYRVQVSDVSEEALCCEDHWNT